MSKITKIAVDAMGGDNSPKKVLDGIIHNHNLHKDNYYKIFGNINEISKHIEKKIDEIDDLIVDESVQRCEKSWSIFAGGTGGNNFIFFINPTIDNVKAWDASGFGGDKENRIFSMLIRSFEIVKWKNKNSLKVQVHGVSCNVSGAIGCYSILIASERGIKKVEGPTPNPQ